MGAVIDFVDQELYARGDMKFAEFLILAKVGCPVGFSWTDFIVGTLNFHF